MTAGSSDLGDCFYIESPNRARGMRVTGAAASRNTLVSVSGIISTVSGERTLKAGSVTASGSSTPVRSFGMRPSSVGGGACGYQDGVWGWSLFRGLDGKLHSKWDHMAGANNIGLLVTTWGRVIETGPTTVPTWFVIDDGSGNSVKCVVPASVTINRAWGFAGVTGISSCEKVGDKLRRVVRIRDRQDISAF